MSNKNFTKRIIAIFILVFLIATAMIIRIIYLANTAPKDFSGSKTKSSVIERGKIYDRNNRLLSISVELNSCHADPEKIKDKIATSKIISNTLLIPERDVYNKLTSKSTQNKNFVWIDRHIKRELSENLSENLKNSNIKGVYFTKEYKRFYPNNKLASHILGFCDIDNNGIEGIEKTFNDYLSPKNLPNTNSNIKQKGYNLSLTIDSNIQMFAEDSIRNGVINEKAESGTLILADGKTGELLALANYPDFDPNNFSKYNQEKFRNIAIFNQYEPGSAFKIFSIAPLLDSGLITNNEHFLCEGTYTQDGETVRDSTSGRHGLLNISGIFKYSCNVATLKAVSKINKRDFYNYLKLFGFGEPTMIYERNNLVENSDIADIMGVKVLLPGEQKGKLRDVGNWSKRSMLVIPIGQEISVNAMQMIQASTVFVNDGILLKLNLVRDIYDENNKIIQSFRRKEIRRVLKEGVSSQIIEGMKAATDEIGGTARFLKIDGLNFAAKSGTAEIFDVKTGKYSDTVVTSSLLTIFPAENPRYIAYVVFHNVKHTPEGRVRWGGIIGAKLLDNFISKITGYIEIDSKVKVDVNLNNLEPVKIGNRLESLPSLMPNLVSLSIGDAVSILSKVNLNVKILGNGNVVRQTPIRGETIKDGDTVILYGSY